MEPAIIYKSHETEYSVVITSEGIWLYFGPGGEFIEHVKGVNTDLKAIQYLQGWVNNPTIKLIAGDAYDVYEMEHLDISVDLAGPAIAYDPEPSVSHIIGN